MSADAPGTGPGDDPAMDDQESSRRRRGDPERVVTFTDGVFAIIITILVLEIHVPEGLGEQSLRNAVEDVGPTLVAWIVSFLITGTYWVWHRDVFAQVRRVDRNAVWLNLVFLVPVSLIPFAASLLGEYPGEAIALQVYGAVLIAASGFRALLFRYLSTRPSLLHAPISGLGQRIGLTVAAGPIVVYLVAMLVASVAAVLSLVLFASVPLLYFLGVSLLRRRPKDRLVGDDYS